MNRKIIMILIALVSIFTFAISSKKLEAAIYYQDQLASLEYLQLELEYKVYDPAVGLQSELIPYMYLSEDIRISVNVPTNILVDFDIFIEIWEEDGNYTVVSPFAYEEIHFNASDTAYPNGIYTIDKSFFTNWYSGVKITGIKVRIEHPMFTLSFLENTAASDYMKDRVGKHITVRSDAWGFLIQYTGALDQGILLDQWYFDSGFTAPDIHPVMQGGYYNYVKEDWEFIGWYSQIANEMVNWDLTSNLRVFVSRYFEEIEPNVFAWSTIFQPKFKYVGGSLKDFYYEPQNNLPPKLLDIIRPFNLNNKIGFFLIYLVLAFGVIIMAVVMRLDLMAIVIVQTMLLVIAIYFQIIPTWVAFLIALTLIMTFVVSMKRGGLSE